MAEKGQRTQTQFFQATKTFAIGSTIVRVGDTVEAGHPLLRGRKDLFAPFRPRFGMPSTWSPPGAAKREQPTQAPEAGDESEAAGAAEGSEA